MCIVCCFPEEFLLDDYSKYTYLSNGHMPVPGVDDTQEFRSLVESMTIMGFSPEDQSCLLYTSPSPRDEESSRMPSSA